MKMDQESFSEEENRWNIICSLETSPNNKLD